MMGVTRGELLDRLADHLELEPLTEAEIESLLAIAAVAAHGTGDRTSGPLATFLAGAAAGGAEDRTDLLDRVRQRTGAIIGPQSASAA
jgi:NhaP-type Na+/H+ or K+/H+ antiporter